MDEIALKLIGKSVRHHDWMEIQDVVVQDNKLASLKRYYSKFRQPQNGIFISTNMNKRFRMSFDFGTSNLAYAIMDRQSGRIFTFNMLQQNPHNKSSSDIQFYLTHDSQSLRDSLQCLGNEINIDFCSKCVDHLWFQHYKRHLYKTNQIILYPNSPVVSTIFSQKQYKLSDIFYCVMKISLCQAINNYKQLFNQFQLSDIDFILTVPAMALDQHKQFMRCCFYDTLKDVCQLLSIKSQPFIEKDNIILVIEPEAAFFNQINYYSNQLLGNEHKISIIDIGGGTWDHSSMVVIPPQKDDRFTLVVKQKSQGGLAGGSNMDDKFILLMNNFFDLNNFSDTQIPRYIKSLQTMSFYCQFQKLKHQIMELNEEFLEFSFNHVAKYLKIQNQSDVDYRIIQQKLETYLYNQVVSKQFETETIEIDFQNHIIGVQSKTLYYYCFVETQQVVTQMVVEQIKKQQSDTVFCVGGLSNVKNLQNNISTEAGMARCLSTQNPSLAIVQGALIFDCAKLERICQNSVAVECPRFLSELQTKYQQIAKSSIFAEYLKEYQQQQLSAASLATVFRYGTHFKEDQVQHQIFLIKPSQVTSQYVDVILHVLKTANYQTFDTPEIYVENSGHSELSHIQGYRVELPSDLQNSMLQEKQLQVQILYRILDDANIVQCRWKNSDPWKTLYLSSDRQVASLRDRLAKNPIYFHSGFFPSRIFCCSLLTPLHVSEVKTTSQFSVDVQYFEISQMNSTMFFYPFSLKALFFLQENRIPAQVALVLNLGPCFINSINRIEDLYISDTQLFANQARLCFLVPNQIQNLGQRLLLPTQNNFSGSSQRYGFKASFDGANYIIEADLTQTSSDEMQIQGNNRADLISWLNDNEQTKHGIRNLGNGNRFKFQVTNVVAANKLISIFNSLVCYNHDIDQITSGNPLVMPVEKMVNDPLCYDTCGADSPKEALVGYFPFNCCQAQNQFAALTENTGGQVNYCLNCSQEFLKHVVKNNRGSSKMSFAFDPKQNIASLILSMLLNKVPRGILIQFLSYVLQFESHQIAMIRCVSHPQTEPVEITKAGQKRLVCLHCGLIFDRSKGVWVTLQKILDEQEAQRLEQQRILNEQETQRLQQFREQQRQDDIALAQYPRCPNCGVRCVKISGCNHVTCYCCHVPWCYGCQQVRTKCRC